jgi:hypothetical protein
MPIASNSSAHSLDEFIQFSPVALENLEMSEREPFILLS